VGEFESMMASDGDAMVSMAASGMPGEKARQTSRLTIAYQEEHAASKVSSMKVPSTTSGQLFAVTGHGETR